MTGLYAEPRERGMGTRFAAFGMRPDWSKPMILRNFISRTFIRSLVLGVIPLAFASAPAYSAAIADVLAEEGFVLVASHCDAMGGEQRRECLEDEVDDMEDSVEERRERDADRAERRCDMYTGETQAICEDEVEEQYDD